MKVDWEAVQLHLAQQIFAGMVPDIIKNHGVGEVPYYYALRSIKAAKVFVEQAQKEFPDPKDPPLTEEGVRQILRGPATTTESETKLVYTRKLAIFHDQILKPPAVGEPDPNDPDDFNGTHR